MCLYHIPCKSKLDPHQSPEKQTNPETELIKNKLEGHQRLAAASNLTSFSGPMHPRNPMCTKYSSESFRVQILQEGFHKASQAGLKRCTNGTKIATKEDRRGNADHQKSSNPI